MVAVISGNGLGLLGTSAASLGMAAGGQAGLGQSGASQYVNVATGNLIVTDQDERLVAQGLMAGLVRTYNSLGSNGDLGAGSWLLGLDRRLGDLTGTLNASGSSLTRDGGDGETQVFAYDSTRGLYVASEKDGASDTLQWNATDSSWSYTAGGSLREETYDASGTLKALRDGKTGASYTLGYNAGQQLESVTAGDGEALLLQYDAAGRVSGLSTLEIPAGGGTTQTVSRVSYHYDTLGRLDTVTTDLTPADGSDAQTFTTTYGYDGSSLRLASLTQSDGVTVSYTYSQDKHRQYRIASVTLGSGADAQTQSFAYDLAARTTTVTDAGGRAWTYGYDAKGNLVSVTSPAVDGQRQVTAYTYDNHGHVTSVTDAIGNTTVYGYDARGNRIVERDGGGNTISYTYNDNDQLLTRTVYLTPQDVSVASQGSAQAQVQASLHRNKPRHGHKATQVALVTQGVTAATGATSTTRYVYDASNRLRYLVDADGGVRETRYNDQGLVELTRTYAGAAFDTSGLAADVAPKLTSLDTWAAAQDLTQSSRTDYRYDASGRLQQKWVFDQVDASGHGVAGAGELITRYVYDAQGLLRQQIAVRGADRTSLETVSYTYDGLGRLLGQSDALGHATTYAYHDDQGTLVITQANGLVRTEAHNSAGELLTVTSSAVGETIRQTRYVYDAKGQLRATQDAGGAVSYRFYDGAGRLAGTVDATGAVTRYQRDADGRTVATTQYATRIDTTGWFGAGDASAIPVDLDGVLPVADAHDRTSLSLYDASGRLAAEVDADGYATTYVYDGAGNLTASTAHAVALTADQRLALQASPETTVLAPNADDRTSYTFHDLANRVVGTLDASGYVTTTAYDAAGRVTKTVAYATGLDADQRVALGNAPTLAGVLNHLSGDPANPDDQVTRNYYDDAGRLIARIDAGGYLSTTTQEATSHEVTTRRFARALSPAQLQALTGRETLDTLTGLIAGSSFQTQTNSYDADGRLARSVAIDGSVTVYAYNDANQLTGTGTTPPAGGQVRTSGGHYDTFGDLLTATDGAGATTTYTYNVRGQRVLTTDALGNQTWNVYDPSSGRLVYTVTGIASDGTANALGEVTHFQYDSFGEVVQTTRLAARLDLVALGMDTDTSVVALEAAVATIADPAHDASTTTDYTHRGQVAERRDALGYATTVSYDAFGDTVRTRHQVTQPGQALSTGNSVITTYRYDARGQQTDRTDDAGALNRSTRTQYDAFGRITAQLDGRGNAVSYTYDRLGRQITASQVVQGGPRTTQSTYDAYGRVLTRTDAMGQVTTYGYSPDTHTLTVTTPDAVVVTRITDAYGDTLSVTDGAGNTTSYRYDGDGRLVDTIDALGQTRHHDYNAVGQLTGSTDASGRVVGYTYDALGRTLTRTVDPDGLAQTTRYAYDGRGQQVSVTDANGIVSSYAYDADGQLLTQVEDAGTGAEHLNLTTTYTWNGAGEQLSVTEGAGTAEARTTQYVYDSLGRRTQQIIDPAGLALTTDYVYDGNDNLVAVTDPKRQTTRYVYDQANQQVYTIDPAGAVVQSFYDADGRVTATRRYATAIDTTGLGTSPGLDQIAVNASSADQRRYTVYDAAGRVHYTVDPLGFISEQRYDAAGRLAETIAYAKAVSNQAFNNAHLFEAMVAGTADADMAALIGAAGNTEANAHASVNLYDEDGRVRFVVQQNTVDGQRVGVVHERRYDAAGRVTDQLAYGTALSLSAGSLAGQLSTSSVAQILAGTAAHQTRYVHDGAGQVRYTIDAGGYVSEQQYDGNGRVVQALTYLNAITVPASLSETSVAAAISARNTAASTRTTTTAYDHAGRVHTTGDALGINETYRYDATGLKTAFTNRDGKTWTYTYDGVGRLLTETSPTVTVGTFGGTASVSTTSTALVTRYTYDANGNVLSRTEADGTSAARTLQYRYDSRGHQIQTIYPDAGYVDQATGVYHATGAGTTTATVTYDALGHAVVNQDVGGHYQYKLYDTRGALSYEVDANGYVSAYRYDAYGNQTAVTRYATALDAGAITGWTAGQPLSATQLQAGLTASADDRTLTTVYDQRNQKVQVTQDTIAYTLAKGINARQSGTGTPTTTYSYDAYGNLVRTAVKVQEASGTPGTASYDEAWWATTYHYYDALGHKVMDVDPMGYVSTWAYDGSGQVTTAIEYANAIATGSLSTQTRPGVPALGGGSAGYDRKTTVEYDAIGRKASVITSGGFSFIGGAAQVSGLAAGSSITRFDYDGEGRVTTLTVNGATTHTTYDALGRVVTVSEPARRALASNWQAQLRSNPALDLSQFDSSLYLQVAPTTSITYDALGSAIRTTRSAAGTAAQNTYAHYDGLGRQVIAVDAKGTSFYSGYDATGNVTANWYTLTGNDGATTVTTRSVYDATGQRLSTTVSRAGTIESAQFVKYNAFGEITAKGDGLVGGTGSADGYEASYSYNRAGQLVSGTDAQHAVQHRYSYSLTGAQLSDTWDLDGSGHTASLAWHLDLDDRRVSQFQPSTTASTGEATAPVHTSYDRWGNVLSTTDARGYVTRYSYDSQNHLYAEVEPQTLVVHANGSRSTVAPTKYWYYDINGRLAGTRDENGHGTRNSFDAAGQLIQSTDATDANSYVAYDGLGRAVARQTPPVTTSTGPVVHITWSAYDADDQLTSQGDFLRTADGRGRTQVIQQSYLLNTNGDRIRVTDALGFQIDSQGHEVEVPGHTAYYDFDSQHHVVKSQSAVQRSRQVAETFGYDRNGHKISHTTANGDHQSWVYDHFGRLLSHTDLSGALTRYTYDSHSGWLAGETTQWSAHVGQSHAQSDPSYLAAGQTSGTGTITYSYCADGQLHKATKAVGTATTGTTTYTYDAAGQATRTVTDTTDGAGQATHTDVRTDYDSHGRISVVTELDATKGLLRTATVYDAAGNRRAVYVQSGLGSNVTPIDTSGTEVTATDIADQSTPALDSWHLDASNSFTDPLAFGLSWHASLSDGVQLPSWLHFSQGVFSGTPATPGRWSVTVTATDIEGHLAQVSFNLEVRPAEKPPTYHGGYVDRTAIIGQPFDYPLPSGAFTSPGGQAITYSAKVLIPAHTMVLYPLMLAPGGGTPTHVPDTWVDIREVGLSIDAQTGHISGRPTLLAEQTADGPDGDHFVYLRDYQIRVDADNGFGGPTSATFELTTDSAPVFGSTPVNQKALQGHAFSYVAPAATDADGDTPTYSATDLPPGIGFDAATRTFAGTPTTAGVWSVGYAVSDGKVTTSKTFIITVAADAAPSFPSAPLNQSAMQGVAFSYVAPAATDADGDVPIYSAAGLPPGISFSAATRTFAGTPTATGSWTITYKASDGTASTSKTFILTVKPDTRPVYNGGYTNRTGVLGQPFDYPVPTGAFTSPGGLSLSFSAKVLIPAHTLILYPLTLAPGGGTPTHVPDQWVDIREVGLSINAQTGEISGRPTTLAEEVADHVDHSDYTYLSDYQIQVFATNASGITTAQFHLTNSPNATPSFTSTPVSQGATQGLAFSYIAPAGSDANGDILTYSATGLPPGLTFTAATRKFAGTPTTVGSWTVTYAVSDGVASTRSSFIITVKAANRAPTFPSAPVNQSATQGVAFRYVAPAATDADGDVPIYSAAGLPPGISFSAATRTFAGTPTATGSWTVTYKASDGTASVSKTFTLTVKPNTLPVYNGGYTNRTGVLGQPFDYPVPTGAFTSPGGLSLNFSAKVLIPAHTLILYPLTLAPGGGTPTHVPDQWVDIREVGLSINAQTGEISGRPTTLAEEVADHVDHSDYTYLSDYQIQVFASNSSGTTTAQFHLTNGANTAPSFTSTPINQGATQGVAFSYTAPAASDANGDSLSYSATGLPPGITFSAATRKFAGTPTTAGTWTVTYTVSDGVASTRSTFTIAVKNANRAPAFPSAPVNQSAIQGVAFSYVAPAATDADGDSLTYSATGLPPGITFSAATRKFAGAPSSTGSWTVTYRVSDGKLSTSKTFTITVKAPAATAPVYNGGYVTRSGILGNALSIPVPHGAFSGSSLTYSAKVLIPAHTVLVYPYGLAPGGGTPTHVPDQWVSIGQVGLSIDAQTGTLSGRPTTLAEEVADHVDHSDYAYLSSYQIEVIASNNLGSATGQFQFNGTTGLTALTANDAPAVDSLQAPLAPGQETTTASTTLHASLLPAPDPGDEGGSSPPPATPNTETYWFTYDADNRVVINNGTLSGNHIGLRQDASSYELHYDGAGNAVRRLTLNDAGHLLSQTSYYDERNELVQANYSVDKTLTPSADDQARGIEEQRRYDAAGHLVMTAKFYDASYHLHTNPKLLKLDPDAYDPAGDGADVSNTLASATIEHYDADGRLLQEQDFSHAAGWQGAGATKDVSAPLPGENGTAWDGLTLHNQVSYRMADGSSGYDAAGNVLAYQYKDIPSGRTDTYTVSYLKKDSYLEAATASHSSDSNYAPGNDTSFYDVFGQRLAIRQHLDPKKQTIDDTVRAFAYDANGQILQRRDGRISNNAFSATGGAGTHHYAYVSGQQVGAVDADGTIHVLDGLTAFSNTQTGTTDYVVQEGDSLKSIAQAEYGNASLWYVIAQANGIASDDELAAGQSLSIPQVTTNSNDASTFKPYSPAEIAGSTTPPSVYAPPPPSQHCNTLAMIIVIVVVIVATVMTAGAAAAAMGVASTAAGTTGAVAVGGAAMTGGALGAAAAGSVAAAIGTTATGMIAAAAGGFVGSIAGQLAGDALGVSHGFSWNQAIGAGLGAGITAGLSGYVSGGSNIAQLKAAGNYTAIAEMGAASSAGGYLGNKLVHEPAHFSWANVAAASIATTATAAMDVPTALETKWGTTETGDYLAKMGGNLFNGGVESETARLLGGDAKNGRQIVEDAFGNTVANAAIAQINEYQRGQQSYSSASGVTFNPRSHTPLARFLVQPDDGDIDLSNVPTLATVNVTANPEQAWEENYQDYLSLYHFAPLPRNATPQQYRANYHEVSGQVDAYRTLYNKAHGDPQAMAYLARQQEAAEQAHSMDLKANEIERNMDAMRAGLVNAGNAHGTVMGALAQWASDQMGMGEGLAIGGYKAVSGLNSLAQSAEALLSPEGWMYDSDGNLGRLQAVGSTLDRLDTVATALQLGDLPTLRAVGGPMLDAMTQDYQTYWAQGDYSKLAGRLLFDVGSLLVGGEALKTGAFGDVARVGDVGEAVRVAGDAMALSDDLVALNLAGKDTSDVAAQLAKEFTHSASGPNSGSVVLGRWRMTLGGPGTQSVGYIDVAKWGGGTWFEAPESFWPRLKEGFITAGYDPKIAMLKADDAAFLVNEKFMMQQAENGMPFRLVNTTPHHAEQFFRASATMREINLLNSDQFRLMGYVRKGNSWVKVQQ